MSGIYLHIPFCHHKCTYCDFHFSVNQKSFNKVFNAILKEIEDRKNFFNSNQIDTIYFGGGTPSILSIAQVEKILNTLSKHFIWKKNSEISFECNPEDISLEYLNGLKSLGINRISLGVQSLNNKVLQWMGRKHTSEQSIQSIQLIKKSGIENFSVDLIFGIPFYPTSQLKKDIEKIITSFEPPHISAYQLTIEPKTKLNYLVRTKQISPASDNKIKKEFLLIHEILIQNNYHHYEISNYSKENFIAQHNSSYWLQKPYLGIGPSAHSYNNHERRWNIANNYLYAQKIFNNETYFETEVLQTHQKFNEYIYTRLRTTFGCNLLEIEKEFGLEYKNLFLKKYELFKDYFNICNETYTLTLNGFLIADKIASEFFVI